MYSSSNYGTNMNRKDFEVLSGFYCDIDFQATIADQIEIKALITIGNLFLKLSQRQVLYTMLHFLDHRMQSGERSQQFRHMTISKKFQYIGSGL